MALFPAEKVFYLCVFYFQGSPRLVPSNVCCFSHPSARDQYSLMIGWHLRGDASVAWASLTIFTTTHPRVSREGPRFAVNVVSGPFFNLCTIRVFTAQSESVICAKGNRQVNLVTVFFGLVIDCIQESACWRKQIDLRELLSNI